MPPERETGSGEDRLIARFFAPLATAPGALGLSDDAAFIKPPAGHDLVLTTDALVEGVHFFADDPADSLAQKGMRVNLSDLAAKGARPLGFLLSLALTEKTKDLWLESFARGLRRDIDTFACPLFGGDTVKSPGPVMINVAMFGAVPEGTMVRRSGARPGDTVLVSGTVGDAALGLLVRQSRLSLSAEHGDHVVSRYLLPQPRNALADAVRAHASAAMDVSDGLIGDLAKLCAASGVAAEIDIAKMPFSLAVRDAVRADPKLMEPAVTGGDDYEILCTAPRGEAVKLMAAAAKAGIALTQIGSVQPGEGVRAIDQGREIAFERRAFSHF